MKKSLLGFAAVALCGTLAAQETDIVIGAEGRGQFLFTTGVAPQMATMQFIAMDRGFNTNAAGVKGAPYTAEGATEFIQTLGDGTRIVRKNVTKSARDSEGRLRTEPVGSVAGPINFELPATITINDPVAKEILILNEREKTAERIRMPDLPPPPPLPPGNANGDVIFQRAIPAPPSPPPPPPPGPNVAIAVPAAPAAPAMPATAIAPGTRVTAVGGGFSYSYGGASTVFVQGGKEAQRESTGKQVIAGVSCDGTRITSTIPAGQIGNDREIRVVTETCYSPELKLMLLNRTVDPMNGETSFRVSSLSRTEPAKSLFQIPAGYALNVDRIGGGTSGVRIRTTRKQ